MLSCALFATSCYPVCVHSRSSRRLQWLSRVGMLNSVSAKEDVNIRVCEAHMGEDKLPSAAGTKSSNATPCPGPARLCCYAGCGHTGCDMELCPPLSKGKRPRT